MSRYSELSADGQYSASMRDEQKALLNGLLSLIYDSFDTSKRMQLQMESIHRLLVILLVLVLAIVAAGLVGGCYVLCRRYQDEQQRAAGTASPGTGGLSAVAIHQRSAKSTAIEI